MHIRQFVVGYGVEQDRLRAMLPAGSAAAIPCIQVLGAYTVELER